MLLGDLKWICDGDLNGETVLWGHLLSKSCSKGRGGGGGVHEICDKQCLKYRKNETKGGVGLIFTEFRVMYLMDYVLFIDRSLVEFQEVLLQDIYSKSLSFRGFFF